MGVTQQLDLTPYVRGAVKQGVHLDYHLLRAMVKNRGGDAAGGHYFCQAQAVDNFWYTFDNEAVRREVSISYYDRESYLCFYKITGASRNSPAQAQVKPRQVEVSRVAQFEEAVDS